MSIICEICGGTIEFDGGSYKCTECGEDYGNNIVLACDDELDIPEGCRACGGPYPDCMDSCPIFDD